MKNYLLCVTLALASFSPVLAQSDRSDQQPDVVIPHFQISSTTFTNGATLPLSMVLGSTNCSFVSGGGDQSPEVSWINPPRGTRSFVVTLYDVTAAFTHWGMYNISPDKTGLPANAGIAGSTYGKQVFNDFYYGAQYDGPCPPPTFTPYVHNYILTVFALDTDLCLPAFPPNFPANGEALYRAMFDHVIARASIHGYFSTHE